jgi:hypothetical protein
MSFQQPTSYEVRGSDLGIRSGEQSGKHVAKNGSVLPDGCWISELETIETLHQRTDELNWGGGGVHLQLTILNTYACSGMWGTVCPARARRATLY